jgi:Neuraminidase (sialidase)
MQITTGVPGKVEVIMGQDRRHCPDEQPGAVGGQHLFDAFTLAGLDAEGCDVSYAIWAQREVVLRDDD